MSRRNELKSESHTDRTNAVLKDLHAFDFINALSDPRIQAPAGRSYGRKLDYFDLYKMYLTEFCQVFLIDSSMDNT